MVYYVNNNYGIIYYGMLRKIIITMFLSILNTYEVKVIGLCSDTLHDRTLERWKEYLYTCDWRHEEIIIERELQILREYFTIMINNYEDYFIAKIFISTYFAYIITFYI